VPPVGKKVYVQVNQFVDGWEGRCQFRLLTLSSSERRVEPKGDAEKLKSRERSGGKQRLGKQRAEMGKGKAEVEPGGLVACLDAPGLGRLAAFARGGLGVGESQLVELMQLPPEELLVRQRRLVFGDESWGAARLRAYSTTSLSLVAQRRMPMEGRSWGFFTSRSRASR
jgi:hypothetical protein